jgi:hypothetical protein
MYSSRESEAAFKMQAEVSLGVAVRCLQSMALRSLKKVAHTIPKIQHKFFKIRNFLKACFQNGTIRDTCYDS